MSNTSTHTEVEFSISYGDGEIDDDLWGTAEQAQAHIDGIRVHTASGFFERDDYPEPMTVVTRTVTRTISATPWEEAQ